MVTASAGEDGGQRMSGPGQTRLMSTYPPHLVTFTRGQGSRLWDDAGRQYLDFLSGLAVTSLGHSHPAVADAVCEQARTLLHVSNLFGTEPQREVAATLDRLIDSGSRSSVLLQQRGGGQRGCHQAGKEMGRS